jgi:hypothetical protein
MYIILLEIHYLKTFSFRICFLGLYAFQTNYFSIQFAMQILMLLQLTYEGNRQTRAFVYDVIALELAFRNMSLNE